jgi:tetratricopeptide (TPR) repeat protein
LAHYNYGRLLADGGRFGEAAEQFAAAVKLAPENGEALLRWGLCLAAQGRLAEAEGCFEKAVRYEPGLVEAREALARVRRR